MSMNLIQIQNGYKSFATKDLFIDINLAVNTGEHIGVVGANGTGKTTFFKILIGSGELDSGKVIRSKDLKLGYLAQEDHWDEGHTPEHYLQGLEKPLWELKTLGEQLGISPEQFTMPISSLSGGYRMRCKLLRLIGENPNLLLLDEPTNYLDLESLIVLENFLINYEGAFLLITHDHEFLKRVTNVTVGFENHKVDKITGNVDFFFEQKKLQYEIQEKHKLDQDKKKQELENFIKRFGAKATKAKQAQSKMKQLEKMEDIEAPSSFQPKVNIRLPKPVHSGRFAFEFEEARLGYGEKTILNHINLSIERGNHIAVVGYNGAGKSTFLKGLGGLLPLQAGVMKVGMNSQVSYFGQHVPEELNLKNTIIEELHEDLSLEVEDQMVLDIAGALMFSGDDLNKSVSVLSGGEKVRVSLAKILLKKSSCLLLDEPTNHLDFYTVASLAQALKLYEGTVVFVSHDRKFVKEVAQKVMLVNNGQLELYPGTYEEYVWSLQKGILSNLGGAVPEDLEGSSASSAEKTKPKNNKNYKRKKELSKLIKKCERDIEKIEADISNLNKDIQDQEDISEKMKSISLLEKAHLKKDSVEELWLSSQEEFDSL